MRHGFVLTQGQGDSGHIAWERTTVVEEKSGLPDNLAADLRPWALATLLRERSMDGRYFAYLVELDSDTEFDTDSALSTEEVIWFYEQEHVPAS
jgi:hypothetical protein